MSDIIENFLKVITKEESEENFEITPIVKSLKGSFKAPKNLDYKKELTRQLSENIFKK